MGGSSPNNRHNAAVAVSGLDSSYGNPPTGWQRVWPLRKPGLPGLWIMMKPLSVSPTQQPDEMISTCWIVMISPPEHSVPVPLSPQNPTALHRDFVSRLSSFSVSSCASVLCRGLKLLCGTPRVNTPLFTSLSAFSCYIVIIQCASPTFRTFPLFCILFTCCQVE